MEITDRVYLDTIVRMAILAEHHKPGIRAHLERMRGYTYILASEIGFSYQDADVLSYACILHDIGEIGIPEVVYSRSGSLSEQEWNLVRRHPEIGAQVLGGSQSPVLQAAEVIALTHHERWDGSGYPQALIGDKIPLSGRICGIADVFDALTTHRPYKQPISVGEARNIITQAGGSMFDPQLTEAFNKKFDEIARVHRNYSG